MSNNRVTRFNYICGNAPTMGSDQEYWKQLENQAERVLEEAQEMYNAVLAGDIVKVLDGHLDVKYTNEYIDDLLTVEAVNVRASWEAVCDNNDSKFTPSYSYAMDSKEWHESEGIECYIDSGVYEGETFYCVRRHCDNKILKPIHFKAVELEQYCPKQPEM